MASLRKWAIFRAKDKRFADYKFIIKIPINNDYSYHELLFVAHLTFTKVNRP